MKKVLLILLISLLVVHAKDSVEFKFAEKNFQRKNPTNQDYILSYNNILKNVRSSVVNISTKKTISSDNGYFNPFFKRQRTIPSSASGSGVIISKNGYIVTNNHVVDGADEIKVSISNDKKKYTAKLIGKDAKSDIAIIKIEAENLNAVTFYDSDEVKIGDIVFALGNPFGVGETITQGIVSATKRSSVGIVEYENFIQTDASINPGNSGGALINSAGHLIGINSAIISRSGGNDGIGFAIPSNMITSIATALIDDGKYTRAYLGVGISDVSDDMSSFYNNNFGALITSIEEGTPAFKAGLKRGDLIIAVDGKKVQSASELKNVIGSYAPHKVVNVKFLRDKKIDVINIELGSLEKQSLLGTKYYKGLSIIPLKLELEKILRSNFYINGGVMVSDVEENSEAFRAGIIKDDIIIQIENNEIKNIQDFKNETNTQTKKRLYIFRRGAIFAVVL